MLDGVNRMLISTKGRYVTRMLVDIAMHQADGYVSMKDIAERQQISKKYLETFTASLECRNSGNPPWKDRRIPACSRSGQDHAVGDRMPDGGAASCCFLSGTGA